LERRKRRASRWEAHEKGKLGVTRSRQYFHLYRRIKKKLWGEKGTPKDNNKIGGLTRPCSPGSGAEWGRKSQDDHLLFQSRRMEKKRVEQSPVAREPKGVEGGRGKASKPQLTLYCGETEIREGGTKKRGHI